MKIIIVIIILQKKNACKISSVDFFAYKATLIVKGRSLKRNIIFKRVHTASDYYIVHGVFDKKVIAFPDDDCFRS